MKNSKFILATLVLATMSLVPNLHAACTNATIHGNWGFTGTGVVIVNTRAVPVAAVGAVHFDLEGNVSGDQNRSIGGGAGHETFSGTYTIAGDCALSGTVSVYDDSGTLQRTTVLKGIVVNNGKEIRLIYDSITLPNGAPLPSVLTLEGNKI
jgi:hypothetical protein